VLVVKTVNPPGVGAGLTVAPDPNYKILSGGIQLPAGSSHRLTAFRPNMPPAGNVPTSWSPSWLTGDIDPSASARKDPSQRLTFCSSRILRTSHRATASR
jgi:hypothetical protein